MMCTVHDGEKVSAESCSLGRGRQKRHVCKGGEGSLTQTQSSTLAVVGWAEALRQEQVLDCSGIMGKPEQSDQTTGEKGDGIRAGSRRLVMDAHNTIHTPGQVENMEAGGDNHSPPHYPKRIHNPSGLWQASLQTSKYKVVLLNLPPGIIWKYFNVLLYYHIYIIYYIFVVKYFFNYANICYICLCCGSS